MGAPAALHRGGLMGCGSRPNPDLPSPQACAVGLIAVGVATQVVLSQTIIPGATTGSLVPVVIIAVGAFLFLVAFVGCCGACKENYCLMIDHQKEKQNQNIMPSNKMNKLMKCLGKSFMVTKTWQGGCFHSYLPTALLLQYVQNMT